MAGSICKIEPATALGNYFYLHVGVIHELPLPD